MAACNGVKQPLVSGSMDPTPLTNGYAPKKRRLRRCKSAPLADICTPGVNGKDAFPGTESFFGKPHPNLRKIAAIMAVYLGLGTICFYVVKDQIKGLKTNGIVDALYFCIVTMTTVGYGDLVPNTVLSKLLACAFVFSGMAVGGLILSKAADYLIEKQEILLVKTLHMHQKEVETNRVKYKSIVILILLLGLIIVGTIFLATVEKLSIVDAFYCVCSTITTLGYGDKSFSTKGGRIFAIIWILTSTVSLALLFMYITELKTEKRQKALVKWVLTRRMSNVDLEAADLDEDGVVGAAEFVIYKLREMGKITQEDITLVMEEFEDLDVDQSGTLSASDINIAQSSQTKR